MMARKMCECGVRPVATKSADADAAWGNMCSPCWEYAGWENAHSDHDHDGIAARDPLAINSPVGLTEITGDMTRCPVCHPELDPRSDVAPAGHTDTVAKTYTSHRDHRHAATPAHRALCRASMAANGYPYADPDWDRSPKGN